MQFSSSLSPAWKDDHCNPLWCGSWGRGITSCCTAKASQKISPSPWEGCGHLGGVSDAYKGAGAGAGTLSFSECGDN